MLPQLVACSGTSIQGPAKRLHGLDRRQTCIELVVDHFHRPQGYSRRELQNIDDYHINLHWLCFSELHCSHRYSIDDLHICSFGWKFTSFGSEDYIHTLSLSVFSHDIVLKEQKHGIAESSMGERREYKGVWEAIVAGGLGDVRDH